MKKVALFLFLSVCFAQQSCSSDSVGTEPEENPQDILFKDDFNFFDEKVWTKETHEPGWTNQELQAYDAAHVSVGKDGDKSVLILTAERKGNKIYSGRINSKGKKSFKYRKIEASIKLPKTNGGLWPAFWMMGDNDKHWLCSIAVREPLRWGHSEWRCSLVFPNRPQPFRSVLPFP